MSYSDLYCMYAEQMNKSHQVPQPPGVGDDYLICYTKYITVMTDLGERVLEPEVVLNYEEYAKAYSSYLKVTDCRYLVPPQM